MKAFYLIIAIALIHSGDIIAQSFSGIGTYKYKNKINIYMDSTKLSPAEMQSIQSQAESRMQKEFTLTFNNSESSWKQVESLNSGIGQTSNDANQVIILDGTSNSILYKNLSESRFERDEEIMGKRFIVKDDLKKYEWKLTGDTKKIGQYNCEKAVYQQVVDSKRFSSDVGKMEIIKDTIETIAWFTPDIPVSHGPEIFYGLPGLILELKSGNRTYICEQITLNPKDPVEIERPQKGKTITSEKLQELRDEKTQEMMKRYSGGGGENQVEIRIDG